MSKIEQFFVKKGYDLNVLQKDERVYKVTNLREAAILIIRSILEGKKIFIVADYDCDGVMSAVNLYTIFKKIEKTSVEKLIETLYHLDGISDAEMKKMMDKDNVEKINKMRDTIFMNSPSFTIRFPTRAEGYGISEKIVDEADENSLIITIDNGIAAVEAIEYAHKKGHKVVILDHHQIRGDGLIPDADVVVDPHIYREEDEFEHYCGAGIAYMLAIEMGLPKDVIDQTVTWAALATIADVVPLVDNNRNIVRKGLLEINKKSVEKDEEFLKKGMTVVDLPGLFSLCGQLNLVPTKSYVTCINEEDVKFKIAPCINAMGRMYTEGAKMAFEYLVHYDVYGEDGIRDIIQCNKDRKEVTAQQQLLLNAQAQDTVTDKTTCVVLYVPGLHEGIIGINAAKVCETYDMPAIVLTDAEQEGFLKGSARSVEGIHIKECLDKVAEYVYKYGGHAGAAGLTIEKDKLKDFIKAINKVTPKANVNHNTWQYDFEISEDEIAQTLKDVRKYAPYGEGFPAPIIKVNNFNLDRDRYGKFYSYIGKNKDCLSLNGKYAVAVSFSLLEKFKTLENPLHLNIVGMIEYSTYHKRPQIMINDFQPIVTGSNSMYVL